MSEKLVRDWKDYSVDEINEIKKEKCQKCRYAACHGGTDISGVTCDYLLRTGVRRPCRPEDCELWR